MKFIAFDGLRKIYESESRRKTRFVVLENQDGVAIEKQCHLCKQHKPLESYRPQVGSCFYRSTNCRDCLRAFEKIQRRAAGARSMIPEIYTDENGNKKRECLSCRKIKLLENFSLAKRGFFGRAATCKECKNNEHKLKKLLNGSPNKRLPKTIKDAFGNITHRSCAACKELKLLKDFDRHKSGFLQKRSYCKSCTHEKYLYRKYGYTITEKQQLYQAQNSCCAICQKHYDINALHVDHCHNTGKIRGLLCNSCNCAIGFLGDGGPETISAAQRIISYLC